MSIVKTSAIILGLMIAAYALLESGSEEKAPLWEPRDAIPGASEEGRTKWQGKNE
ncbi:hypothetical protein MHM84_02085 [Halomonas sp. McH1-25]|uniref:hypothetical protein n=1 Tax=unclassified Halomonas TaxID=2609666 RepID=UPI001EF6AA70|nr:MULTISPECIES: hypothetical protein [unclassified Halomonas]MCG7598571.1 hypothetical protein [Halomonas sp. McH1-25]MCP1341823.1 hypothetical protein [Halomonas sp. FL8]MCP1362973.1 hypothetical protein [Halomonas sp. BBD45]MCP1365143.1 hypothetical protein [Halomonas sp. BBD48]